MSEETNNLSASFISMSLHIIAGGRKCRLKNTVGATVMWLWLAKAGKIFHLQSQKKNAIEAKMNVMYC